MVQMHAVSHVRSRTISRKRERSRVHPSHSASSPDYLAFDGVHIALTDRMANVLLRFRMGFAVALSNRRAQAATMVLRPGESEGGAGNRHRGADQWMFVLSGTGSALTGSKRQRLRPGTLLLIERGTTHRIENTGRSPLKTLNVYVPPAYTKRGNERPAGRSR